MTKTTQIVLTLLLAMMPFAAKADAPETFFNILVALPNPANVPSGSGNHISLDYNKDSYIERIEWVDNDQLIIGHDKNANGCLELPEEMIGTAMGSGMDALRQLDTNKDGLINSADPVYPELLIWRDEGVAGKCEPKEAMSLQAAEISALFISPRMDVAINLAPGTYVARNLPLKIDTLSSVDRTHYTLKPETLFMPQMRGYGNVSDLTIAMSRDETLLNAVEKFCSTDLRTLTSPERNLQAELRAILFKWAGVENVAPNSRGEFINAQELAYVEKIVGRDWVNPRTGLSAPSTEGQGILLNTTWDLAYNAAFTRLVFGCWNEHLFSRTIHYAFNKDEFAGELELKKTAIAEQFKDLPLDHLYNAWATMFRLLDGMVGINKLTPLQQAEINELIKDTDTSGKLSYSVMLENFKLPQRDALLKVRYGIEDINNVYILAGLAFSIFSLLLIAFVIWRRVRQK